MNLTQRAFILIAVSVVFAVHSISIASAQYEYGILTLNDCNSSNKCSYDFSTKTFGSVTEGEFYFSNGKLLANNVGQQGLMDLATSQLDPKRVDIPASGFSIFGVPIKSNEAYLSLARSGRENRYILFRINNIIPVSNGKLIGLEYYILETGRVIARTNEPGGFSIYGPRSFSSRGKWMQIDRALVGEYTIVYNDIPGFVTPFSQTKTLGKGKTIVFEGVYQPAPKS